ncbi:MAG: 2Fe-2S iron-sulfur cluster-binding protein [Burkholderiaceae bacterium]
MKTITIAVNGETMRSAAPDRTHLGDFLRENLALTGTHLGCEHGVCGACTVLLDGEPVRSCITFAAACDGKSVTTVEGYDSDPVMQRLRLAFNTHHGLQCGYCTPGMLATARDIVLRYPRADEQTIRLELAGNLCRCTGYQGIVNAISDVLDHYQQTPDDAVTALRVRATAGESTPSDLKPSGTTGSSDRHTQTTVQFQPFDAATSSSVTTEDTKTFAQVGAPNVEGVKGSEKISRTADDPNRIEDVFELAFSVSQVWQFMGDLPAVASCLPGASIDSYDNERVKGRIAIRFGPMSASFVGGARLERNDENYSAILQGAGQDSLSKSRTNADISYQLEALSIDRTRVKLSIQYALQGPLAQFSRSGLVRDFVKRMLVDFAGNVDRRLGGDTGESTPGQGVNSNANASVNIARSLFALLTDRLRQFFRKN